VIAKTDLFKDLDRQHQRVLAFSAKWYPAKAGQEIFAPDEQADAAYLCVTGQAGMYWPVDGHDDRLVSEILPGRLVGDLSVILNEPRSLSLRATEDSVFLRIAAQDLNAVIESDAHVAASLLRAVGGHLVSTGNTIRAVQEYAVERGVDFTDFTVD